MEKKLVVMRRKSYNAEMIILSVLLVLAAVIVGMRLIKSDVIATVNGKEITIGQVDGLYLQLSKRYQNVTMEDALNQAIDETLLLSEAERNGIVVSGSDVEKILASYRNSTSENDLLLYWESQGISEQDAPIVLKKQETINRLLNKTILSNIEVSDEEVESFRDAFTQQIEGNSSIVFEPSPEEVRQAIYIDRARSALNIYLNQLRSAADIEILQKV